MRKMAIAKITTRPKKISKEGISQASGLRLGLGVTGAGVAGIIAGVCSVVVVGVDAGEKAGLAGTGEGEVVEMWFCVSIKVIII